MPQKHEHENNYMIVSESHHRQELETQGFTKIEGFYSAEELAPLTNHITRIIAMLYTQHLGKPFPAGEFHSHPVQQAYMEMVRHNRKLGGVVYDAIKQIPEFIRITSSEKNLALARSLRQSDFMGITRGGDGIRIDYPLETTYMAPWHQDYLSQLGSPDGLVFWSPLVDIDAAIGPLELCVGSHMGGPRPIYYEDASLAGTAYGMRLANEEAIIGSYPNISAPCKAGDLLVVDFLTLHRSGANRAAFPRWSMQLRYFNFNNPHGMQMHWPSGFSQGNTLNVIHPELVVEKL
jgi:hypothetical protein